MKILVLGGTGAMGSYLVPILACDENEIFVTTRAERRSNNKNIHYIQGDAHDMLFLNNILNSQYDVIVDFMSYSTDEFRDRYEFFLNSSEQYIFLSSSRVYADSKTPITEKSMRLLDAVDDDVYLRTDEYALAKARQENMLVDSKKDNWTIVRPYITYSNERLQLGIYEKELWLYRVLHGQTIIFPSEMAEHMTTLTYGKDVACGIAALVGNKSAYRQIVHITTAESIYWRDVINLYQRVFYDVTGEQMKVKFIDLSEELRKNLFNQYQIKYDRMLDRKFDNSKIIQLTENSISFTSPMNGLEKCFREFLIDPHFRYQPSVKITAWMDTITKEYTSLKNISGSLTRIKYIIGRHTPYFKFF